MLTTSRRLRSIIVCRAAKSPARAARANASSSPGVSSACWPTSFR